MSNSVKVLIGEINGQELDQQEEYDLKVRDLSDVNADSINDGEFLKWDNATGKFVPTNNAGRVGSINQSQFFGQGSVSNKWLALGASSKTSDKVPYVVTHDRDITGFTFSNDSNSFSTILEVYKNGISPGDMIFTTTITNKLTISKTNITRIPISHGDRISVFLKNNGANPSDPVVTINYEVTAIVESEVST